MKKNIALVAFGCLFFSHAMAGSFVVVTPPDSSASAEEIELYERRIGALTQFQKDLEESIEEEESLYEQCANGNFHRPRSNRLQGMDCGVTHETLDPDFIYIKGVFNSEDAESFYKAFEEEYQESLYFPSRSCVERGSGCMVISKASLRQAQMLKRVGSEEAASLCVDGFKVVPVRSNSRRGDRDSRGGGSVEGSLSLRWGGTEDLSVSVGATGEAHDKNGNYIEGEIRRDRNGINEVDLRAGHEDEE